MKILVIGESFTDQYFIGSTTRVSPEAPIPVVRVESMLRLPGGAGNVNANLAGWGTEVHSITLPAGIKNRLMVGNHQLARWDEYDSCPPFSQINLNSLPYSTEFDAVVISDYGKGFFDRLALDWLERLADLPFFIDTKADPLKYARFTEATFFPNNKEYTEFSKSYQTLQNVVYKRGADGMEYQNAGVPEFFEKARAAQPVSVIGAGDTVLAAYVYDFLQYDNRRSAMAFASAAAAAAVMKPFTTAPSLTEVEAFLSHDVKA